MALVLNTSAIKQRVRAFGNFFEFNPGQIKALGSAIAHFLSTERRDCGLVSVPERFDDITFRDSDEGKKQLTQLKLKGVQNRIKYLKSLIYNETVSLQQDLNKQGITNVDPRAFMDDDMVKNFEELSQYGKLGKDAAKDRVDKVKRLEKLINENEGI